MAIYYTYLIGWRHLNKLYYGVRYSKHSDPSELWKTYFTSSKIVHAFREQYGDPDLIEVRQQFDTPEKARHWEHKVLKRLNVVRSDKWLNKTDNICFDPELMATIGRMKRGSLNHFHGRKHSEETKRKIRLTKLGRVQPAHEKEKQIRAQLGRSVSQETREKLRKANKGQIPWNKGKVGVYTEESNRKRSESEKRTKACQRKWLHIFGMMRPHDGL